MAGEVFLVTRFRNAAFREGAPIIIATGMKAHPSTSQLLSPKTGIAASISYASSLFTW
jgi:hypothetical protein